MGLLVLLSLSDHASAGLRWEAGAKGGLNWARLTGDQVGLWLGQGDSQLAGSVGDNKLGFNGGIFVTSFLNDFFGIQAEAMYVQKGGEGIASGTYIYRPPYDNPREVNFDGNLYAYVDYIEFPVLAVFDFEATDNDKVRLRGFAGPVFSFSLRAEARLKGTAYVEAQDTNLRTQSIDEREEIGERVKSFEFGMMFGGAVYWDIGKVDLLIESRWEKGLTTLDNTTLGRDIKTSNVSLLFGFSYPFGG